MVCMKCGRDIEESRVFCDSCLEVMEKYPVKPGTVVTIPRRRPDPSVRRQPRKRVLSPQEQLKKMRKLIRTLIVWILVLIVLCGVFGYFSLQHFLEEDGFLPGQNYSAIQTTEETITETE